MSRTRDDRQALLSYRKSVSEIEADAEYLRSVLHYDAITGEFTWLARSGQRGPDFTGKAAGSLTVHGRVEIGIKGQRFFAHELAWVMTHNRLPDGEIDHINGDPADNRLSNLRDVSRALNMQNLRRSTARNKTGYLGVVAVNQRDGGKPFRAYISVAGRSKNLGSFDCPKEAHQAYLRAKRKYHPGNTL